ncbi:MAG: glycosyltransferase family 4 protein, partial [Chloroflexota bacterium]
IQVAYLGGPVPRDVAPDPELSVRYDLPSRYFLFVGTLQPRKNLLRLLEAYARLRQADQSAAGLVLAGRPGVGASDLRRRAEALGILDRIRWLSYVPREHLAPLYAGAVAFVFPSLYEGFGLPILEAMAWGTPVVSSNAGALPEVVGEAGLLVDPHDVAGLAVAMEQVLGDQSLRERLIQAGRARAGYFTWNRCAVEVERAFAASG